MEVEEENTSNHLQNTTTTVSNESLLENNCRNDIELGIEAPESKTLEQQGEKSSVISPKLDDPNPFEAVAAGETAEEKEVVVEHGNTEPTSLLNDEKEEAEGAGNDGISTSNVAYMERAGSELTNSATVDVGESEAAVIENDKGEDGESEAAVIENDKGEEDTNTNGSFVIENDKDGIDDKMETVKEEEAGERLLPAADIGETEEVMAEVKSDGIEGVDAEVVADEEEEEDHEDGNMEDEEKAAGVAENDDEDEEKAADEEKSLDTELDTDEEKVPTEEMETELSESVVKGGRGKRKRGGKNSKATPKSTAGRKKIVDEDVCFICFDGGDLVLCDLR